MLDANLIAFYNKNIVKKNAYFFVYTKLRADSKNSKIFKKNIFDNYYLSERGVKTGVSRAIAITKRADDDIVAV